jgi:hypothetical protein
VRNNKQRVEGNEAVGLVVHVIHGAHRGGLPGEG